VDRRFINQFPAIYPSWDLTQPFPRSLSPLFSLVVVGVRRRRWRVYYDRIEKKGRRSKFVIDDAENGGESDAERSVKNGVESSARCRNAENDAEYEGDAASDSSSTNRGAENESRDAECKKDAEADSTVENRGVEIVDRNDADGSEIYGRLRR